MDLKGRSILAHKGLSDRASKKIYRESSREACAAASGKKHIDIIELDLRKSADGVLYCYHGSLFQYCVTLKFPRRFSAIRAKYGVDVLTDILDVIPADKTVYLDMKDTSITREDVLKAFSGRQFREVILGNKSISFLSRFSGMSAGFVKTLNGNILYGLHDLDKMRTQGFKYYEATFPFQVRDRVVRKVRAAGLKPTFTGTFFFGRKSYWEKVRKYDPAYVSSDFIDPP